MLYLDCGNTALKCMYQGKVTTLPHQSEHFNDALKAYLNSIPAKTSAVFCSVASPSVYNTILNTLNNYFDENVIIAKTKATYGALKTGYEDFKQLGADRWLCLIATLHLTAPKIIIDVGSWIKMDVVLNAGQHQGGVIISKSSAKEADIFSRFGLSSAQCNHSTSLFGTSTQSCLCLAKGLYNIDAINVFLSRWLPHINIPCHIIVTGGDAPLAIESLKILDSKLQNNILDIQHIENLVLLGLSTRYSP